MFRKSFAWLFAFMAAVSVFWGCKKEDSYSKIPEIKFVSLEKFDYTTPFDSVVLTFSFTDGDGDIGVASTDTATRDVFAKLYELKNGNYEEWVIGTPILQYALPYMEPRGSNESLKGEISIAINYNILQPNDTIRYDVYIFDRAGNKSNTITTSSIVTSVQ